ncbi:MAG: LysM peptidoglycan-binding domain-containing M23 family metallopeptidase [Candidatus Magasanikbacteria bacterium]
MQYLKRNAQKNVKQLGGPSDSVSFQIKTAAIMGGPISPKKGEEVSGKSKRNSSFVNKNGAAIGVSSPVSDVFHKRNGQKIYEVQEGDTLSEIASSFDISLKTLKLANPEIVSTISPGDKLIILPVSGILYKTKKSDTLASVAKEYEINPELIKEYNPNHHKLFDRKGSTIVLPYAEPKNKWTYLKKREENQKELNNFFKRPAAGYNWGKLHYDNAVDIANDCGTPIKAAAEGIVIKASDEGFWNDGYGNYILIEHPNGTKTKYAHTKENFVAEGDYVLQGEKIAIIGNSGNTHGPTGCHLHFEVRGGQNPFAQN